MDIINPSPVPTPASQPRSNPSESWTQSAKKKWGKLLGQVQAQTESLAPRVTLTKSDIRRASIANYNRNLRNIKAGSPTTSASLLAKEISQTQNNQVKVTNRGTHVKKAIAYAFTALAAGAAPPAILLAPVLRSGTEALHSFSEAFANRGRITNPNDISENETHLQAFGHRLLAGLGAFSYSLTKDITKFVLEDLNTLRKNPVNTLNKHLFQQANAPKTWGKIGALIGGGIGAALGGPLGAAIGAGIGYAIGRAVGHAIGHASSRLSSSNEGLSLTETLKQSVTLGLGSISKEEKGQIAAKIGQEVNQLTDLIRQQSALTQNSPDWLNNQSEVVSQAEKISELTQLLRSNGGKDDIIKLNLSNVHSDGQSAAFLISVTQLHQIAVESTKDPILASSLKDSLLEIKNTDSDEDIETQTPQPHPSASAHATVERADERSQAANDGISIIIEPANKDEK